MRLGVRPDPEKIGAIGTASTQKYTWTQQWTGLEKDSVALHSCITPSEDGMEERENRRHMQAILTHAGESEGSHISDHDPPEMDTGRPADSNKFLSSFQVPERSMITVNLLKDWIYKTVYGVIFGWIGMRSNLSGCAIEYITRFVIWKNSMYVYRGIGCQLWSAG